MKSTILDLCGVILIAAFAFFVWPPASLLVVGAACLLVSMSLSRDDS